ncbi:SusC/RagA family TonB-linked outer membrane protein [Chitinophaga sp.]|uniref:SusC/RagA family TonB-linked outer membrane protein n=1 Tax=Chitinophaga sp. TaxID=1869181 RepID=UPI002BFEDF60|nr:SusC/RagA family TonB-linked outer membrane protein [Chitinophaga sp.]HWV65131.1 SusC/RagA family TonB-linked outer membrane protein [Chitinophaga sp.]
MRSKLTINIILTFTVVSIASQQATLRAQQRPSLTKGQLTDTTLQRDPHHRDEIVQLGYSTQLRGDVTGAVATVSGETLERSPVANLTQTLPGRLAGLTTMETFSELSRANTNLFIRGISSARQNGPLVVIDGIICAYNSNQTLEYISASEIESVSILKDASTQALYGIQGANGIIVITTKRGQKGKLKVKVRMDQSFQQVTTKPAFYNSADYAAMRNQAAFNDGLGDHYLFSEKQIEGYRNGTDKQLYPNNNWYEQYMKDIASMQRVAVNLSAGNDNVQFFSNINVMHQGGQFKTDQVKYDPNANNVWVNYRSNLDMTLNKYIKGFLRLSGNIKRERTPGSGNATVYGSLFQMPPTTYGPLTPDGNVVTTERVGAPTYGMLNRSGYYRHTVTNISSQVGLEVDLGFLTKGLSLTGTFAYQTNAVGSLGTTQNYERWIRTDNPDTLAFVKKGSDNNTPLAYGKASSYYYHLTYNAMLNYKREFNKHRISGLGYMFYQNLTKADVGSPALLPYTRLNTGAEAAYAYDNRYFVKLDIGYSGSEQYARSSRFVATPAISAGWELSNENFMKPLPWLSQLKLRASWGKTGNDQSGLARFSYLDNVTLSGGGPIGYLQYIIKENQVGNPAIQAEISTKQNAGIDLGLFHALTITVDVFKERMENMVVGASSKIPLYQGIPLNNYPQTNSGIFENKGYEITANYTKSINRHLDISAGVMLSYQKNTIISWNEAERTADYAYRLREEGYSFGQEFGYLVDYSNGNGFFNSKDEIVKSNLTYGMGTPRPGDLKYRDLNGDNIIDDRDKAPVGNGMLPRKTYAISGGVRYKAFDLNFLFQGVGEYASIYGGQGVYETDYDGVFGSLHANAWTQERYDRHQPISYPALSLQKTVNHEANDFFSYNRSYLRLKNIELSYTLPASIARHITADKIRVLLSGQNLFTWDHMKSGDFGPEGGGYTSFPVYKVYNIGVSVGF